APGPGEAAGAGGGPRGSPGAGGGEPPAARTPPGPPPAGAAASSMPSVTLDAPATIVPRPSPGYSRALLACPIRYRTPAWSTGGIGRPVATSALPRDQPMMSAGIASICEVGLET